ncbi:MAG: hypothetical protein IKG93_11455 [Clostridiales bacterium]|nr:hypothetical protein [Clostridiales bacterium]
MKSSYKLSALMLIFIVLVMIVGGIIQDRRAEKKRVVESATKTIIAAGCKEVDDDFEPDSLYQKVDASSIDENIINKISESIKNKSTSGGYDGSDLFMVVSSLTKETCFRILETTVDGDEATVKVEFFFGSTSQIVDMKFFNENDQWVLENDAGTLLSEFSIK